MKVVAVCSPSESTEIVHGKWSLIQVLAGSKEQYCIQISYRFPALEDLDPKVAIIVLSELLDRIPTFSQRESGLLQIEA
jgi:hypothetical protein